MARYKLWIAPTLLTLVLGLFVFGSAYLYNGVQAELKTTQSSLVAKAIAVNLVNEMKNVTRLLNGMGQLESQVSTNKLFQVYHSVSKILMEKYPGYFYAVNFITPQGIIEKIYPYDSNINALGRNLMARPEVKPYLELSKAQKKSVMSHRLLTYQGIYAVIIYEPLYNEKGEFKGWLNALIDIDRWLNEQMKAEGWSDYYVGLRWGGYDNYTTFGHRPGGVFGYDFEILNQKVHVDVGLPRSSLVTRHNRHLYVLWFAVSFLLLAVIYLLFRLTRSTQALWGANQQLNLKNVLLNSLAHDLSNLLTTLSLNVESILLQDSTTSTMQKNRIGQNLATLNEMLASVRSLSQLELEKENLKLQTISLETAVEESLFRVKEQALQKGVSLQVAEGEKDWLIQADEKTLINNVIPNILNNAIKFTKPHSVIAISTEATLEGIALKITDEGKGFTPEEVLDFNKGHALKSKMGTLGEIGSGLGLSQVKGFMHLYGGYALIGNSDQGAVITLYFKSAH